MMRPSGLGAALCALALLVLATRGGAAMADQDPSAIAPDSDRVMITVFLKHTQELNLEQMGERLRANGFFKKFPPEGVEVVSWIQLMSFGHVVTMKVPPAKVRQLNRALESSSYTTFKSEVYVGYDFWPVIQAIKARESGEAQ